MFADVADVQVADVADVADVAGFQPLFVYETSVGAQPSPAAIKNLGSAPVSRLSAVSFH